MHYGLIVLWISTVSQCSFFQFSHYMPPFNESYRIYRLCTDQNDKIFLGNIQNSDLSFYLEKYILCWPDYERFVPTKHHAIVWFLRALRGCEVNQILSHHSRPKAEFARTFHYDFLKYSYALICEKGAMLPQSDHAYLYAYSGLFNTLYQVGNADRQLICDQISRVYADLYGRCYVPHVEKRQKKIEERCNGVSAPLLKFPDFFLRFSRKCNTFKDFITNEKTEHITTMGIALTTDVTYMNLLSSNLFSNIHSDSELPSLVLKTRLLLQHFSLAAIKLWNQLEAVRACRYETKSNYSETYSNETDEERMAKLGSLITHNCCPSSNIHICDINNERKYQRLAKNASLGFRIEAGLLIAICFNTFLLCFLLCKTYNKLSTATILFVLNIMGSNIAFMLSFTYFFVDLLYQDKYGPINEDYMEKSPELVIAETLQTHLFAHSEFKKHLVQETLYSLAQNGSLTGLIHLLVLVLVVINRSMSGKSIHLSKISVVSVFACVWIFLIASHVMFSIMQMNAINNLDALFSNLSKGRVNLSCNATTLSESGYEEIATHCDRTAIFHAFGAYLLRGHTLFTILFLSASIIIFVITVTYHIKVRRQHDIIHSELRTQSPHQRRERLFHTLILSIVTFFLSVMGQTYIEIAVFWVNEREDIAQLSRWYHYVRILAFIDPVMNPLIVILRTPALRRQLRSQWTTIRSRASSRTRSAHSHRENRENTSVKRKRSSSARMRKDAELMMSLMPTDRPSTHPHLTRSCSLRRSQDSQTHNSVV
ncbi:hypothetical protein L5515_019157 [Caenorhabditis briggsae]|uniref:G-protein coupled receptors family 1 profile domain-containing protein n=1 Tax=Caenorhabditis briggsae TaxID=6238 RepID=A0AAE8ZWN9_CAEBR|nr:hypothetical protein L3Y34_013313 [Caenorhabditis briggsae]UMM43805.1 hypothetical protein L5515_019157 [Caenorhabditis briggsae]